MFRRLTYLRLLILFFLCQLIVNCLNTVTLAPFFHAGMYSESFDYSKDLEFYEIVVNGKLLNAGDYSIYKWDMMQAPLIAFQKQQSTRDYEFDKEASNKAMKKLGLKTLSELAGMNMNNSALLPKDFPLWYKAYVARIVSQEVDSIDINVKHYRLVKGNYLLQKTNKWISA